MRTALRILAGLIGLAGLLTMAGGIAAAVYVGPDDTIPLSAQTLAVPGVALVTTPGLFTVYGPTLHLHAGAADHGRPLFIGVGPSYAVVDYLKDQRRTQLSGYTWNGGLSTSEFSGRTSATGPTGLDFWAAKQQGDPEARLDWKLPNGAYDVVVMRADGSAVGDLQLSAGLELVGLFRTFVVIAAGGVGVLVLMSGVIVRTRRGPRGVAAGESA